MEHPPWEVLSVYAQRYRVPKRRADHSLKEEAELANDILEREKRMYKLNYGCFYESKHGRNIVIRKIPLKLSPHGTTRKSFVDAVMKRAPPGGCPLHPQSTPPTHSEHGP